MILELIIPLLQNILIKYIPEFKSNVEMVSWLELVTFLSIVILPETSIS